MTSSSDADALAALQLAYDRLQQQHQALAAFLGTASHELRAPINQVMSLHQLVLEDLCESPEEEREFIGQAHQAMTRMLHNLDTLISLSKLDIGALSPVCEPVALAAVLNKVQQFTEMQCINRQCRLAIHPDPALPWVLSDERWLLQALLSWVTAALTAGSTAISLEWLNGDDFADAELRNRSPGEGFSHLPNDSPTVTLRLTCNAHPWPPDEPAALTAASSNSRSPTLALDPSFRYGLTHRILAHLGHALRPAPSPDPDGYALRLTLPQATPRD